jgi:hypothetical protein
MLLVISEELAAFPVWLCAAAGERPRALFDLY